MPTMRAHAVPLKRVQLVRRLSQKGAVYETYLLCNTARLNDGPSADELMARVRTNSEPTRSEASHSLSTSVRRDGRELTAALDMSRALGRIGRSDAYTASCSILLVQGCHRDIRTYNMP
jgi:hypothetical protein